MEFRVLFDFDPPALIFGEVPMQRVQLVSGQQIDVMLDECLAEEVTALVEKQSRIAQGKRGLSSIRQQCTCDLNTTHDGVFVRTSWYNTCRRVCPP